MNSSDLPVFRQLLLHYFTSPRLIHPSGDVIKCERKAMRGGVRWGERAMEWIEFERGVISAFVVCEVCCVIQRKEVVVPLW